LWDAPASPSRVIIGRVTGIARARHVAVLLLCSALIACAGKADPARQSAADKQRVAEYLRTFLVERNWAEWPNYFAAGASVNGSTLALKILQGTAEGLNYSFADLKLKIVDQVAEPGHVATYFVIEGLHERPFDDQPATHARVRLEGFVVDRLENGKIVDSRMFLDVWGLSRQVAAAASTKR
jgi:predicted ester cyclase